MKKIPYQIPDNWTWATMAEIADVVGGGTPRTNDSKNYDGGTIPWITPADLSGYTSKYISSGERSITQKGLQTSSAKMTPKGTVLFSSRAPVGYVVIASNPVCTNQGFKSFVLKNNSVLSSFVYWWLKGSKELAESLASGTTFLELSGAKAKQIPIPIAPLEQQKLIVAEIEKQFSRLDEAVANLNRIKANLTRYKAAILKAAVEGKLTESWRKVHPDVEPASKLLARILTARRANWKGKGKYKEPNSRINADLPTLPSNWVWVSLDQLFLNITDGDHQPPPQTDSGVPFLVIGNVRSEKLNFEDTRFVSQEYADAVDAFRKPTQGDILYTLVGSFGIALQVDTVREFCIQRHIGILRPHKLSPTSYLVHVLNSSFVFNQAAKVATGTAQKTVPLAGLRRFSIPLAPQAEQQQIVIQVDRHLSVIEKLEASVIASLTRADRLHQCILQQAFSGRLKMTEFASTLDISPPTIVAPIAAPNTLSEEILMNKRPTNSSGAIRPILDVLQETGEQVAPEKLFSLCGLDSTSIEQVEGFYAELNSLVDANKVEEFRLSIDSITLRARG